MLGRRRSALAVLGTHGVADNATTAIGFLAADGSLLEGNPIYRSLFRLVGDQLIHAGVTGSIYLPTAVVVTAILGTAIVAIAAAVLYLGWELLEDSPGFGVWIGTILAVGVVVPATNLAILSIHLVG